jgi:putative SOS response-associated peptidase YedK
MPAVIPPDGWDDWLGENSMNEGVVKTLLQPYPGQAMAFWAVDRRDRPAGNKQILPMRSPGS